MRLPSLALLMLGLGLALAAWSPPAQAGTAEAPEITDPANDQAIFGVVPIAVQPPTGTTVGLNVDLLAAWVNETADAFTLTMNLQGTGAPTSTSSYLYTFHLETGGQAYEATAALDAASPVGSGGVTPGGVASAALMAGDGLVVLTVPKANVGSPVAGATLTGLSAHCVASLLGEVDGYIVDDAPDSGGGQDYTVTGGAGGGTGNATDADGDGLNDTWEDKEFGNTTAQNGTGDPDHDGLNNTAEQDKGTNATKADTDGDGLNDKDDPFPLDPAKPGAAGNGTGGSGAGGGNATDADHDGLNDTWERAHFGNLTQKGSGDPDRDGLNNTAEQRLGTDPLKADTDGDGLSDATDPQPLGKADDKAGRPELYTGSAMFAAAATFCLFGLARRP